MADERETNQQQDDNTHKDREFLAMADAFIALANKYGGTVDKGKVSAAFLYAAARFNTFIVAGSAADKNSFQQTQQSAMDYFLGEYRKMLVEHMADYEHNFELYIKAKANGDLLN